MSWTRACFFPFGYEMSAGIAVLAVSVCAFPILVNHEASSTSYLPIFPLLPCRCPLPLDTLCSRPVLV
jgi:hypothetical protein